MSGSLPGLMDFHAKEKSDRFEILAFHDATAKTFAELDEKLVKIKAQRWQGRDLPFPILLDATGETIKQYGVHAFPTTILIDPEGRLVADGHRELLQALKDALAKEKAGGEPQPAKK